MPEDTHVDGLGQAFLDWEHAPKFSFQSELVDPADAQGSNSASAREQDGPCFGSELQHDVVRLLSGF